MTPPDGALTALVTLRLDEFESCIGHVGCRDGGGGGGVGVACGGGGCVCGGVSRYVTSAWLH